MSSPPPASKETSVSRVAVVDARGGGLRGVVSGRSQAVPGVASAGGGKVEIGGNRDAGRARDAAAAWR